MKGNSYNCCNDVLITGKFLTTSALSQTSHSCSSLSLTLVPLCKTQIGCFSHRVVTVHGRIQAGETVAIGGYERLLLKATREAATQFILQLQ